MAKIVSRPPAVLPRAKQKWHIEEHHFSYCIDVMIHLYSEEQEAFYIVAVESFGNQESAQRCANMFAQLFTNTWDDFTVDVIHH